MDYRYLLKKVKVQSNAEVLNPSSSENDDFVQPNEDTFENDETENIEDFSQNTPQALRLKRQKTSLVAKARHRSLVETTLQFAKEEHDLNMKFKKEENRLKLEILREQLLQEKIKTRIMQMEMTEKNEVGNEEWLINQ